MTNIKEIEDFFCCSRIARSKMIVADYGNVFRTSGHLALNNLVIRLRLNDEVINFCPYCGRQYPVLIAKDSENIS